MKRILITGASGFLGSNVATAYSKDNAVFGIVNRTSLSTDRFTVIQADLCRSGEYEKIVEKIQPHWVIHCAALANVDECEKNPALAKQLNEDLPAEIANVAREAQIQTLYVSTDAVFSDKNQRHKEEDRPLPTNVYAQTKLAGEQVVAELDPQSLIIRVNFYGWSLTGTASLAEWILSELSAKKKIKGFTDVYFCPLLVNDLAKIMLEMLRKELTGLFHVVGKECISKYEFAVLLANKFGHNTELIEPSSVADSMLNAKRSNNLCLDTKKLQGKLGRDLPTVQNGLDEFYQLYSNGYREHLSGGL